MGIGNFKEENRTSELSSRGDRGVSRSIKDILNSILKEDVLSYSDSEEPTEESLTNKVL